MNDALLLDVLRAAGHEDAANLASKVLEAREPAPAEEPAEEEPAAAPPPMTAPALVGPVNPAGEAEYFRRAMRRDLGRGGEEAA